MVLLYTKKQSAGGPRRLILRTDGPPGLFRGLVPQLFLVLNPSIQLTLYEQLKAWCCRVTGRDPRVKLPDRYLTAEPRCAGNHARVQRNQGCCSSGASFTQGVCDIFKELEWPMVCTLGLPNGRDGDGRRCLNLISGHVLPGRRSGPWGFARGVHRGVQDHRHHPHHAAERHQGPHAGPAGPGQRPAARWDLPRGLAHFSASVGRIGCTSLPPSLPLRSAAMNRLQPALGGLFLGEMEFPLGLCFRHLASLTRAWGQGPFLPIGIQLRRTLGAVQFPLNGGRAVLAGPAGNYSTLCQGRYSGMLQSVATIYRGEGLRGFFRGLAPTPPAHNAVVLPPTPQNCLGCGKWDLVQDFIRQQWRGLISRQAVAGIAGDIPDVRVGLPFPEGSGQSTAYEVPPEL